MRSSPSAGGRRPQGRHRKPCPPRGTVSPPRESERPGEALRALASDETQLSAPMTNSRLLSAEGQVCPRTTYVRASQTTRRTSASPRRSHPMGRAPRGMPRCACRVRRGLDAPRPAAPAGRRAVSLLALARAELAGIAAAHRDHDVGRPPTSCERLRELLRDVEPG
jgi:hypothetical protein